MKRTLLTAITLYLLYDRQKRVEARLKSWKMTRDAELRTYTSELNEGIDRILRGWAKRLRSETVGVRP